jgi:DHA1 family bicyclomycin/chloramphenicol resistance-like MFS transporter
MNVRQPISDTAEPHLPLMTSRKTAIVGAILIALGPISMALYTPAMPTLVDAFATDISTVKLTLTVYFLGFALAQLACGPLSDAYGRRPVTLAFMGLYLAGSIAALVSPTIEILLAARFLQGVGAAAGIAISRAIVRDTATGLESAKIMNTIGIILAIGPALSPTIGGITLDLLGWHAIFAFMVLYGAVIVGMVLFALPETNRSRDPRRAHPGTLLRIYLMLLGKPGFMGPSITIGLTLGGLFTLATMLPFVLIGEVGLSPTEFGLGMIAQSVAFICGGIVTGRLLARGPAGRLVMPGLIVAALGAGLLPVSLAAFGPTYLGIIVPISIFAFAIALVMPALQTNALAPFPTMAGAAAALMGFFQMGGGLLGSLVGALLEPAVALGVILPGMVALAIASQILLGPGVAPRH